MAEWRDENLDVVRVGWTADRSAARMVAPLVYSSVDLTVVQMVSELAAQKVRRKVWSTAVTLEPVKGVIQVVMKVGSLVVLSVARKVVLMVVMMEQWKDDPMADQWEKTTVEQLVVEMVLSSVGCWEGELELVMVALTVAAMVE